jgi:hypothetical protein
LVGNKTKPFQLVNLNDDDDDDRAVGVQFIYVPIESKTPSQVLFNLFFIPTALPITIQ